MNILLINDNPVVNKLVTLSAQKTSDNLEVVDSLANLESSTYDLVVIDDTLYSDELHMELNAKVKYSSSLYICARDAEEVNSFTKILKKPFLPTDLVELFSVLSKETDEIDLSVLEVHEDENEVEDEVILGDQDLESLDDLGELDELEGLDELEDLEFKDEELENLDELEDDVIGDSVLDDDEAQKVKELLQETDSNISLDEELEVEVEIEEEVEAEIDIASQIENAVEDLSEEELESEIDEGTLLDIVSGDLDSLTSRDMKLAVGEEVDSLEPEFLEEETAVIEEIQETVAEENKGVEALKNILIALSDKNVAASMKGMKISINITLGDN
ncbi:MAG: hypothetical protein COA39_000635 [Sulfurimonas sp.]|nr:hypothetical protein [Sulfurimonas sp.]